MKLSVGTNWDNQLIEELSTIPEVYEVFGSANMTVVGTGRASFILGKITKEDMPKYIMKIHEKGMKFNYTLNAPCLSNTEFNKNSHMELIEQLEWLVSIGIDGVTVTIPYLLEIVKKRFPKLHAKVSVISQVNTTQKARFYEDMGADEILLDYMINRDFKLLEKIRKSVSCKLSLLVNDLCTYGCAYRNYHYNILGHASQTNHQMKGFYVDYCTLRCNMERLKRPSLIISARWIRPEDLKCYENIGYENFKIGGRRMSTEWIVNATKAYSDRSYNDNLADILDYPLLGAEDKALTVQFETVASGAASIKPDNLIKLAQLKPKRPYIDNKSLDGFIDFFYKQGCKGSCEDCNYCRNYSEKAIKNDSAETKRLLEVYEELYKDLVTSRMFLTDVKETNDSENAEKNIIWTEKVTRDYEYAMSKVPEQFRLIARQVILKAIIKNTLERCANEVAEEDMVNALLNNTPDVFRNNMISGLRELGIDIDSYLQKKAE